MTKERVTTTFSPPKTITGCTSLPEILPITDPAELERLSIESLSIMLQRNKGDLKALGAIKEVLDRVKGKSVQPVAASIETRNKEEVLTPAELFRQLQFIRAMRDNELQDVTNATE